LGLTLQKISEGASKEFYQGSLSKSILKELSEIDSIMTEEDFRTYKVWFKQPKKFLLKDYLFMISTKFSLFALSLSLLWCLGFMGLSLLSGWNQLSKHYGTTLKKTGLTYGFRTILLRYRLSYELSTRLTFTKEGLLVALIFLFRPGHMPLFIPWDDISVELKKEMLFTYTVDSTIGQVFTLVSVFDQSWNRAFEH